MSRKLSVCLLVLLFLCGSTVLADDTGPMITVTGTGEVQVDPDEVVLEVGIRSLDKDIAKSRQAAEVRLKNVLELAAKYGLGNKDIQSGRIAIEPETEQDPQTQRREFKGYATSYTLALTLRDVSKYEALLTDLLQTPVDRLEVVWRSSRQAEERAEARRLALLAARDKATAMAKTLDEEIFGTYKVTELQSGYVGIESWGVANLMPNGSGGEAARSHPGQLRISAEVSVSFVLRPKWPKFLFDRPEESK